MKGLLDALASLKLTVGLLVAVGLLMGASLVVPQKALLQRALYEEWKAERPALVEALEVAGLTDVHASPLADVDPGPKEGFRRFVRREPLGVVLGQPPELEVVRRLPRAEQEARREQEAVPAELDRADARDDRVHVPVHSATSKDGKRCARRIPHPRARCEPARVSSRAGCVGCGAGCCCRARRR